MVHPSPDQLLDDDATAAHVAECESCRRLRELLRPASAAAASGDGELPELRLVDPAHYALHEELRGGVGGMGRIVRATDRRLGRAVAIKQPLTDVEPSLAELLRARFEAEARLTARLEHPAIVTVYEAGRWPDGEPFYAMRLVRGAPLGRLIEQRHELVERIALVAEIVKVGEALAYAHAQGVIHRDVKPDNILVGPYGQTVLIDWGLARDLDGADELPATRAAPGVTALGIGTPHYMPPEQAKGQPPDERLDVYALGATLFHVLAGEPPYAGGAATARATVLDQAPPSLADRVTGIPPALVACVERAMARDPAQRFASMAAFVAELQRFQRGDLLQSYQYGAVERLIRFVRRHRAALAVATLAVVVLAIVLVQSVGRIVDERDQKGEAQLRAEAALAESRGRTASLLALRSATRADALIAALDGAATLGESPVVLQGLVDAIAAGPVTRRIDAHAGGELPAVELPGDRFATIGIDRKLRIWRSTGDELAAIDVPIKRTYAVLAHGARVLACGFDGEAAWIDVDRKIAERLPIEGGQVACAITPLGEPVLGGARGAMRWTPDGRAVDGTFTTDDPVDALAIDASGAVLATTGRGDLLRWTAEGASSSNGHTAATFGLIPFGDGALTAGFDGRLVQWSLSGATPTPIATLYAEPGALLGAIVPLDRGPSPTRLAITTQNTPDTRVLVRDGDAFRLGWRVSGRVVADARGRVIVVDDERVTEVNPDTGAAIRVLGDKELAKAAVATLGTRLAIGSRGGSATLWDLDTEPSHTAEVVALATMSTGLASAGLDGRFIVHDPVDGVPLVVRAAADLLAVRTANSRLLVVDALGVAMVIEAAGPVLGRVTGKPGLDAALSPDGSVMAIAGVDGVELHSLHGGAPITLAGAATAVAFDGDALVTGHPGGVVRRWTRTGERTAEQVLATDATIGIRAIAPFSGGVLATLRDRTVLLDDRLAIRGDWPLELVGVPGPTAWFGTRGAFAQLVPASGPPRDLVAHSAVITASAMSNELAATGDQAGEVVVWNARTGAVAWRIPPQRDAPAVTALAFIPSDELAIGDARGAIRRIPLTLSRATAVACARLARIGRAREAHCP